jgi:tRNA(fMet)-specific endonuclease VapC
VQGYLLDTNIVAFWFDPNRPQHARVEEHIQGLPQDVPLMISAVTVGEIEYGFRVVSEDDSSQQTAFRAFIAQQLPTVLPVSKMACTYYGLLRARLFERYAPREKRRRGLRSEQLVDPVTSLELGMQENDLWLAAQAVEFNLVLVTNDALHHIREVFEELRVENWTVQ